MVEKLNVENIPKELRLILELLKYDNPSKILEINKNLFQAINWDMFIDLAMHHRVYPVLYSKLRMGDRNLIPEFVVDKIYKHYKQNTFQMLFLTAEMEEVSKMFAANNIPVLLLKGPALAHDLYGDISLRTSSDLDVLIPIEQLDSAEEILLDLGYQKDDYIKTVLNDWKWRHHHITFIHPLKKIKVEIHWRLSPGPAKEPGFAELWERRRQSKLTNQPMYLLGKSDLFLFLIAHGARHGWSRIRWLLDIHQLVGKELNAEEVHKLLQDYHSLHLGGQSLILATELLNTKLSTKMELLCTRARSWKLAQGAIFYLERMVNLHTDPVPESAAKYHKQHLFALMSFRQKCIFILSFLYPYPEDKETLPLPLPLHFLYFPLRPFLWAWRKTRKQALT
ncbi:nucleotidyltransferase domain-containing protein [Oceanobacillus chungangensis]|uniref:Renal dipeptidase n=1 Tax=Oceanobacillus chungangensis TaxID=1229152 RepID=A0A3D8PZ32_9BACI|nr:nucleotidyltransferase family protein [Oceanobacillus chungangensis]RDW20419.1 Renal dipeptidase [Oceanobacillus chungangensis]